MIITAGYNCPTMERPAFANLLEGAITRKGVTQEDLAAMVGKTQSYVSQLVRGAKRPSPELAIALARALDADAREFVRAAGHLEPPFRLPEELYELPEPPDEEEIAIVRMIGTVDSGPFALQPGVEFWREPSAARLRRLRFEADEWRDRQRAAKSPLAIVQDAAKAKHDAETTAWQERQDERTRKRTRKDTPKAAAGTGAHNVDPDHKDHDELDGDGFAE